MFLKRAKIVDSRYIVATFEIVLTFFVIDKRTEVTIVENSWSSLATALLVVDNHEQQFLSTMSSPDNSYSIIRCNTNLIIGVFHWMKHFRTPEIFSAGWNSNFR